MSAIQKYKQEAISLREKLADSERSVAALQAECRDLRELEKRVRAMLACDSKGAHIEAEALVWYSLERLERSR